MMGLKDLIVKGPKPPTRRMEPTAIDKDSWFYDGKRGLLIVHECRTATGALIRTDQFTIPWPKVRAALAREDALPQHRKPKRYTKKEMKTTRDRDD